MTHDFLRPYGGGGGGGWTKRVATLERLEPHLADNVSCFPGTAAWAWGSYVQLVASTPADYYPNALHVCYLAQVAGGGIQRAHAEVEIATGAAGAEVPYAVVPWSVMAFTPIVDADPLILTGSTYPIGPTLIPAGTRIAARVRKSQISATAYVEAHLYLSGHQSPVPTSDTTHPLDAHLGGASTPHTITTPSGAPFTRSAPNYPTYSAWSSVLDPAPFDLLVWGAAALPPIPLGSRGVHLQFATGPSGGGGETPRSVLGIPSQGSFMGGVYHLRRPMLVLAGERWSVRASGDSFDYQFFYEEL